MRTIIIDCNNIAHIQHHALDLQYNDEATGAMWGFMRLLLRLAKEHNTHKFVFCWDSRWTHRKKEYPEYKAQRRRGQTPAEKESLRLLYAQIKQLREYWLPVIGFTNVCMEGGFEADDLIASFVLDYDWPEHPLVVSSDRDMFQLLEHCDVLRPKHGAAATRVTLSELKKEHGVTPEQWLEARAIAGDASDNLPGIRRVGDVSALKYVRGELRTGKTLAHIESELGASIRQRNRRLMRLPFSDPAPDTELEPDRPLSFDALMAMCDKFGFSSLTKPDALKDWRRLFRFKDVP